MQKLKKSKNTVKKMLELSPTFYVCVCVCYILTLDLAQNAIQGDAPEGSDTFQWRLGEEIAWAEIG